MGRRMSGYAIISVPKLRRMRREQFLTQRELAYNAGLSENLVARIERKFSQFAHVSTVKKLASALGVKPADLIDYEAMQLYYEEDAKLTEGSLDDW